MHLTRKEHTSPHIHAYYNGFDAAFLIENRSIFKGKFPKRGQELVKQFILKHQKELMDMWVTERYRKLPPLK